jgi:hypothetical protein
MIKLHSRDKDLLLTILSVAVTIGVMLLLMQFIGELHGLILTVVILVVQTSFLTIRVASLERELRISRETHEPRKVSEKLV